MKNLYLHIGTHKTGTSAIQMTLHNINDTLKSMDYRWIEESYWLYKRFTPEEINGVVSYIESLTLFPQRNLIFSSEGYSGGLAHDVAIVEQKAEILGKILSGFNVKVILYLRRQDQFIESMYSQGIHEGNCYTFEQYINEAIDYKNLDWQKLIDIFALHFGDKNIIVRPYEQNQFYQNNIINDFFSCIGLKDKIQFSQLPKFNKSYSHRSVRIARYMNSILSTQEEKDQIRSILQNIDTKEVFDKHVYMKPEKRQEIMKYFEDSNTHVSRNYFHQDHNIFSLSPSDISTSVVDTTSISNEDIAAIMMKFFVKLCYSKLK